MQPVLLSAIKLDLSIEFDPTDIEHEGIYSTSEVYLDEYDVFGNHVQPTWTEDFCLVCGESRVDHE